MCGLYSAISFEFLELFENAHSIRDLNTYASRMDNEIWYGMVWYGMVWYGMVWYNIVSGDQQAKFMKVLYIDVIIFIDGIRREKAKRIEKKL